MCVGVGVLYECKWLVPFTEDCVTVLFYIYVSFILLLIFLK